MKRLVIAAIVGSVIISCGKRTSETKPIRKDITETVFASGVLEAEGTYSLTSRTDGYIKELRIMENDVVKEGQILAVIDNKQNIVNAESGKILFEMAKTNASPGSPQIGQAENEALRARQKMEFDMNLLNRYRNLREEKTISQAEYDKVELQSNISKTEYQNALENLSIVRQQVDQQLTIKQAQKEINSQMSAYNQIYAIKPGRVLKKLKQAGDFVRQGEAIAIIGNTESIHARVNIDESSIGRVKIGQDAFVQLNVNRAKVYKGKVVEILPTFEESTQSFIGKITFMDTLDFKVSGTQLQANIVVGETKNALLIPRNYLGYGNEVRVKGEPAPRLIKTRIVSSDWVQVLEGIGDSAVLITDNLN